MGGSKSTQRATRRMQLGSKQGLRSTGKACRHLHRHCLQFWLSQVWVQKSCSRPVPRQVRFRKLASKVSDHNRSAWFRWRTPRSPAINLQVQSLHTLDRNPQACNKGQARPHGATRTFHSMGNAGPKGHHDFVEGMDEAKSQEMWPSLKPAFWFKNL